MASITRRTPPSLADLTTRYLAQQPTAEAVAATEFEPHEVLGAFQASAQQTWADAVAALKLCGVEPEKLALPPEWAAFAGRDRSPVALPCAAGFVPQSARELSALFAIPSTPRPAGQVAGFAGLRGWLRAAVRSKSPTLLLVAAGVAAGLGDRAEAEVLLAAAEPLCGGAWRAAWLNQQAAVEWALGGETEAWPADAGPVAEFNRGVSALAAGRPADAISSLQAAAAGLPAGSGWPHLANLYLTAARAGY
ncbi:MAG: hypothetical protein U0871_11280 [Gemmataceae bacterium]